MNVLIFQIMYFSWEYHNLLDFLDVCNPPGIQILLIISMSMICFKIVKGRKHKFSFLQAVDTQVIKQIQIMSYNLEWWRNSTSFIFHNELNLCFKHLSCRPSHFSSLVFNRPHHPYFVLEPPVHLGYNWYDYHHGSLLFIFYTENTKPFTDNLHRPLCLDAWHSHFSSLECGHTIHIVHQAPFLSAHTHPSTHSKKLLLIWLEALLPMWFCPVCLSCILILFLLPGL